MRCSIQDCGGQYEETKIVHTVRHRGRLGREFSRCAVLVALRLSRDAAVDIMLLARSGAVALGECKRVRAQYLPVRAPASAIKQLAAYSRQIRTLSERECWLLGRIENSYARFGFAPLSRALHRLGLKNENLRASWWQRVSGNCREGRIQLFVALGNRRSEVAVFLGRTCYQRVVLRGISKMRFKRWKD